MLELSADDNLYTFTWEGEKRHLRALDADDPELMVSAFEGAPKDRARFARDFLADRATTPETAEIVRGLAMVPTFKLFRAWAGMELGESQPSDES